MAQMMDISEIKRLYPDEWVLLGNPDIDEANPKFLSGVVVYHSPDKREVCYLGKPMMAGYQKTALFFNRVPVTKRRVIASLFRPVAL